MEEATRDYQSLVTAKARLCLSNVGHRAVDYCTYDQRLQASRKGRRPAIEWLTDTGRREKLEAASQRLGQPVHNILGLYGGLVSSFRPILAKYLCNRYNGTSVLDFSAGWGGRALGVTSTGARYIGIDTNHDLREGYEKLKEITGGDITMIWKPSETVDYSSLEYDMVLSCPPYGDLETYPHSPSYTDWNNEFLISVTNRAFQHVKKGGWMVLCLPPRLYQVLRNTLGEADETVDLPIRSRRKGLTVISEIAYCWKR